MIKIDHIALYVLDLESAKQFFMNYFDGTPNEMYHNPQTGLKTYFIAFPDGGRIELMQRPNVTAIQYNPYNQGFIHLALSVGSKETVDSLTSRLANDGYEVISGPRTTGDGYYESCIRGFENNLIEITE